MKSSLIILLLLCSLKIHGQKVYQDSLNHITFKLSIDSMPYGDSLQYYEYYVNNIKIYNEDKIVQSIYIDSATATHFYGYMEDWTIFVVEDVNFDGHNDIRLINWLGIRMDKEYRYWLYDNETHSFSEDSNLTHLMNPRFNQQKNTICETARPGGPSDYSCRTYVWNRGSLLMVEQWELSTRPYKNTWRELLCHYEIINGDWEVNEECRWLKKNEKVNILPCRCE